MITLTTAWYVWALLITLVFMLGAIAGQWDAFRTVRRRERERRDEASRFEIGDVVTFGDRSAIVVETLPPEGDHHG